MPWIIKIGIIALISIQMYAEVHYIKEPTFNEVTYVETHGDPSNEAIIFVHGLGDEASKIWQDTAQALQNEYYILLFDLPGFGRSDKSNKLYSPYNYAYFINYLAGHFIQKPFHLVGHSMGASISLKYASMFENIKSLMLIDAAGILNKIAYSQFLLKEKTQKVTQNNGIVDFVENLPSKLNEFLPLNLDSVLQYNASRKVLLRSNPSTIAATALVEEDFSLIPQRVNVNTLIMWGEEDKVAPLRTGYVLHKRIENSKLTMVKDTGHVPIKDAPQIFLNALQEHLKNHAYQKEEMTFSSYAKKIVIENKDKVTLTGHIEHLVIKNSTNIRIKDAKIDELYIEKSDVSIVNSQLNLEKTTQILESTLTITASDIQTIGIELLDSSLDLAGVDISSLNYTFKSLNQSRTQNILFSLCQLNENTLHEMVTLKAYEEF